MLFAETAFLFGELPIRIEPQPMLLTLTAMLRAETTRLAVKTAMLSPETPTRLGKRRC